MVLSIREKQEHREASFLCKQATYSVDYIRTRRQAEVPCVVRTAFQQDCHRIVHSKAFRRLKGKTQVFLWPKGDHYRTRLTHCQEVSQIARTISRALNLNEDLAEAISLGHDLGHTPFGHAGESTLQKLLPGGFRHEKQSLRVVECLERDGEGLNLTEPVRDGILLHSKGKGPILNVSPNLLPKTPEGQIVRLADLIAYVNHDLDDALRAKMLSPTDLPHTSIDKLGDSHSKRLTRFVQDIVRNTNLESKAMISMSEEGALALEELRSFLFNKVYYNPVIHSEFHKAEDVLERLFHYFIGDLDQFYEVHWPSALRDGTHTDDVRDFLAGMTDAYAVDLYQKLFTPKRWYVL